MAEVRVQDGGLYSTIQDQGRTGYRDLGVPSGGAMDSFHYRLANWLVDNKPGDPVVEMTGRGGRYVFDSDCLAAVTGAHMPLRGKENRTYPLNQAFRVKAGEVLEIGRAARGYRAYLAVQGRWKVRESLGSASVYETAGLGANKGSRLREGDKIRIEIREGNEAKTGVEEVIFPDLSQVHTLRVLEGPEWGLLTNWQKKVLWEETYRVSPETNRMGIRLKSDKGIKISSGQMPSSGVVPGVVQLPANGKPIILGKDGQSLGGYPRIAKVTEAELWKLGQLSPGDEVRFIKTHIDEARKQFEAIEKQIPAS